MNQALWRGEYCPGVTFRETYGKLMWKMNPSERSFLPEKSPWSTIRHLTWLFHHSSIYFLRLVFAVSGNENTGSKHSAGKSLFIGQVWVAVLVGKRVCSVCYGNSALHISIHPSHGLRFCSQTDHWTVCFVLWCCGTMGDSTSVLIDALNPNKFAHFLKLNYSLPKLLSCF